ncbi:uncharacterized protein LOC134831777 [Culicoides brevitarsis]|uniref:uncharacterized protein LOC134831777 n=1 Tax=Culicoides brevitarsis TaxID=469753 RepID=UPI00307BF7EC
MKWPSNKKLIQIAAYAGVFTATSAMLMRDSIIQRIKKQDYYTESLKILRAHPGAVTLMGEPIKELGFKLEDKKNFADGKNAHFEVKVKGPKDSGKMYLWAERVEEKWNVKRIELELKSQENKRLVVKKEENSS